MAYKGNQCVLRHNLLDGSMAFGYKYAPRRRNPSRWLTYMIVSSLILMARAIGDLSLLVDMT